MIETHGNWGGGDTYVQGCSMFYFTNFQSWSEWRRESKEKLLVFIYLRIFCTELILAFSYGYRMAWFVCSFQNKCSCIFKGSLFAISRTATVYVHICTKNVKTSLYSSLLIGSVIAPPELYSQATAQFSEALFVVMCKPTCANKLWIIN